MDKKKIFQRTNFLLFLLTSIIILSEAALPGSSSSSQSNFVSNIISSVYNATKNIYSRNVYPTSLEVKEVNKSFTSSSFLLEYKVLPENSTFKNVTFESSDSSIATIDEKGFVNCLKQGQVTLKSSLSIPEKNILLEKEFLLEVEDVLPTSLSISSSSIINNTLTIKEGEYIYLDATILPENTTNKTVSYYIKDDSTFVYDNGSLELIDNNILHIKNYSSEPYQLYAFSNANKEVFNYIKVEQKTDDSLIDIDSLKINLNEDIYVGQTYDLNVSYYPSNTSFKFVKYETDYPSCKISNEGKVTILKKSAPLITIKAISLYDDSLESIVTLKVKNHLGFNASIKAKQQDDTFLLENKCSYNIDLDYFSSTTLKDVRITSSNPSIIKVYDNNTISVLQKGSCYIDIISSDEDESFSLRLYISVINKDFAKEIKSFTLIIRKAFGHFLLFTLNALFLSLFLISTLNEKETHISLILSECSGLYLACLSEIIQYFTPERTCALSDIGIDMLGFNLGIIIVFTIFLIKILSKKHKNNIKNQQNKKSRIED
ncbi:MAG: VanZ family protein [Erysipelotrichaceae bacterium]|nr:VanZ family protein [Erysipelotrichaceae bacterium]